MVARTSQKMIIGLAVALVLTAIVGVYVRLDFPAIQFIGAAMVLFVIAIARALTRPDSNSR
jgi:hypothetical protein